MSACNFCRHQRIIYQYGRRNVRTKPDAAGAWGSGVRIEIRVRNQLTKKLGAWKDGRAWYAELPTRCACD